MGSLKLLHSHIGRVFENDCPIKHKYCLLKNFIEMLHTLLITEKNKHTLHTYILNT
jgi:hypothetical protein